VFLGELHQSLEVQCGSSLPRQRTLDFGVALRIGQNFKPPRIAGQTYFAQLLGRQRVRLRLAPAVGLEILFPRQILQLRDRLS